MAVITGSARGIGKQIAMCFAREGADIVVNDLRVVEMEATAQEIRDLGRKAITVEADITKKEDVKRLISAAIDSFKRVDILVNNAGIRSNTPPLETTEEEWHKLQNVNLKGVFLCTQAVAKHMIAQKYGKIINISSTGALGGGPTIFMVYSVAKAGVIQLTKVWARELGPYGVNVNCIASGPVLTDLFRNGRTPEEVERIMEERKRTAVLGRLGTPQDIANLALFLASDESSFITGQTIVCDGMSG